jgi:hypothetical protein
MSDENESLGDLLAREKAKRERNWDPAQRWKVIQETLAWCEAQATVRRNTPAACLAEQNRKLAWLAEQAAKNAEHQPEA